MYVDNQGESIAGANTFGRDLLTVLMVNIVQMRTLLAETWCHWRGQYIFIEPKDATPNAALKKQRAQVVIAFPYIGAGSGEVSGHFPRTRH